VGPKLIKPLKHLHTYVHTYIWHGRVKSYLTTSFKWKCFQVVPRIIFLNRNRPKPCVALGRWSVYFRQRVISPILELPTLEIRIVDFKMLASLFALTNVT
jgi:hypothetical protein